MSDQQQPEPQPEQHQIRIIITRGKAEITVIGRPLEIGTYHGHVVKTA